MSSVRNRILQFQQNDEIAGNGSTLKSANGHDNAAAQNGNSLSSSLSSTMLKSSYVRTKSTGSMQPDIVTTTVNSNRNGCGNNSDQFKSGGLGHNNNISISTSSLKSFPYGSLQQQQNKNNLQQHSIISSRNSNGNGCFGNNYGLKTTNVGSGITPPSSVTSSSTSLVNFRKYSGTFSDCTSSTNSLASSWRSGSVDKRSPAPEPSTASIVRTVEIPLGRPRGRSEDLGLTPPAVNRANKPGSLLAMKKASMTINLSSGSPSSAASSSSSPSPTGNSNGFIGSVNNNNNNHKMMNGSNGRSQPSPTARTPMRTSPVSSTSSIPKLSGGNGSTGFGFGNGMTTTTPVRYRDPSPATTTTVRYRDPSPEGLGRSRTSPGITSNRTTPATTPTGSSNTNGVAFGSTWNVGGGSSTGRFYQSIGWKEKFEESEKKRNHLVTLAQRATRDYEELRRRYHELYTDHEKLATRFDSSTSQLESLRKASEATYEEYHKLKRRYEVENQGKSDALSRVDEYNRENRRLKRQSAMMMQQIDPSVLLAQASLFDSVQEGESPESDKEIQYLRQKVKELEAKIIDLEAELERIRLSEFESQESVLLMTDTVQSGKNENVQLKNQLRKLDEENRKLARSVEDLSLAHESLKAKHSVDEEKLQVAETELKKLLTEKNILQRQSLVFMNNDEMDNRLLEALAQIDELQRAVEDQKNNFEAQLAELQNRLSEKELIDDTNEIQHGATIKAFEEEILALRERAEEAERKLEDCSSNSSSDGAPVAPPPPPPPMMTSAPAPPPPPPPPSMNMTNGLGSSLQSALTSLKKGNRISNLESTPNGSCDGQTKSLVNGSAQIDDIVSQLKQGIKLRHIDRTMPRKQLSPDRSKDENPVEELRSVLDNMRRTRTVERRF